MENILGFLCVPISLYRIALRMGLLNNKVYVIASGGLKSHEIAAFWVRNGKIKHRL